MPVTLQINLSPADLPVAEHVLPHQLRQLGGQVDEVVLTLDLRMSGGPRRAGWLERLPGMDRLLRETSERHPHVRLSPVDYGDEARRAVSRALFGGAPVPLKNYRGAPIYPYLFGLWDASHDLVLHTDGDMLFGGGSQRWVAEATDFLASHPDVLFVGPLPGPPAPGGVLPAAVAARHAPDGARADRVRLPASPPQPARELASSLAYRFTTVSSRIFMFDRRVFAVRVGSFGPSRRPAPRSVATALLEGNPRHEECERTMGRAMRRHGMARVDLLGSGAGMWSLHPPMRSPEFLAALPGLVRRVESGDVPPAQLGDFDVNDSMVDWTSARDRRARTRGARRLLVRT